MQSRITERLTSASRTCWYGSYLRVVEHEAGGRINWDGACIRRGIYFLTRVQLQSLELRFSAENIQSWSQQTPSAKCAHLWNLLVDMVGGKICEKDVSSSSDTIFIFWGWVAPSNHDQSIARINLSITTLCSVPTGTFPRTGQQIWISNDLFYRLPNEAHIFSTKMSVTLRLEQDKFTQPFQWIVRTHIRWFAKSRCKVKPHLTPKAATFWLPRAQVVPLLTVIIMLQKWCLFSLCTEQYFGGWLSPSVLFDDSNHVCSFIGGFTVPPYRFCPQWLKIEWYSPHQCMFMVFKTKPKAHTPRLPHQVIAQSYLTLYAAVIVKKRKAFPWKTGRHCCRSFWRIVFVYSFISVSNTLTADLLVMKYHMLPNWRLRIDLGT